MEQFETRVVMNKEAWKALRKYWKPPQEKLRVMLASAALALLGIAYLLLWEDRLGIVMILCGFAGPFLHHLNFRYVSKVNEKRAMESAGGAEDNERLVAFAEEEIVIRSTMNENVSRINYNAIKRFAKTENLYALITKENQFIMVNRTQLAQAQKEENFLSFIGEKCKHVKLPQSHFPETPR